MSEKRKDNKGIVLKDGESQRADGRYQYRYTDIKGKRKYLYSKTLFELQCIDPCRIRKFVHLFYTNCGKKT